MSALSGTLGLQAGEGCQETRFEAARKLPQNSTDTLVTFPSSDPSELPEDKLYSYSIMRSDLDMIWRLETGGDPEIGDLIAQDMDIHMLKASGVPEFSERPQAAALLLTGLSEVHANASMFGGIESSSFKMKWKNLDRRGRALVKIWRGEKSYTGHHPTMRRAP